MRLIDADALLKNIRRAVYPSDLATTIAVGICESHVKDMPTIQPDAPRVMTLEEAQNSLHNDIVIWAELKGKILCGGIRMYGTDYFTMQNNDVLDVTDFDNGEGAEMYGKEVRCWTSRPTDEQREAAKWDG